MHDATKVVLGTNPNSSKEVSSHPGDPATFKAGLAVSIDLNGNLSLLKSAGLRMGVSLGKNLSFDDNRTSIMRDGLEVPVRLALKRATGAITISNYSNLLTTTPDTITIGGTAFTAQSGAVTPGDATFRAATNNDTTAASLAAQINAHATVKTKVYATVSSNVVTLHAVTAGVGSTGTGNDVAVSYTDNGGGNIGATLSGLSGGKLSGGSNDPADISYATIGSKVYFNDFTGEADKAMTGISTISDAVYVQNGLTGLEENSDATVPVALADMPGGL